MTNNIEQSLIKNKSTIFDVDGSSMLPLLVPYLNKVKLVPYDTYEINDVVLYKVSGKYYLTRIIKDDGNYYITMADNSLNHIRVFKSDIFAKMVGYYIKDKYIDINDEIYINYLNNYIAKNSDKNNKFLIDISKYRINLAFREVVRYGILGNGDLSIIFSLSKEEMGSLARLACENRCGHILSLIVTKFDLDISPQYKLVIDDRLSKAKSNYVKQINARKEISIALSKARIRHMYIKWGEIVDSLPNAYIRTANDIDIYVSHNDMGKVAKVFYKQFDADNISTDVDVHVNFILKSLNIKVELHYMLLDSCFSDVNSVIGDPFSKAVMDNETPYLYHLEKEYYYLFNLAHSVKHMLRGDLHFNYLFDEYTFLKDELLNKQLLDDLLNQCDLSTYNKAYNEYLDMLMNDIPCPIEVYRLEEYLVNSTRDKLVNLSRERDSKAHYVWRRMFLSYEELKGYAPIIEKYFILTPIYEVKRWFDRFFHGGVKKLRNDLAHFNASYSKKEIKAIFKDVGLENIYKKMA